MKKQLLFYGLLLCSLSLVPSGKKMSRADQKAKVYGDLSNFGVEGGHKGPALIGSALAGLGRMEAALARIPELEQQVGTIAGLQTQVDTIAGLQAQVDTIAGLQAQVGGHAAALEKAVVDALEARKDELATALGHLHGHADALAARDAKHATALADALAAKDGEHVTALAEALAARGHEHATVLGDLRSQVDEQLATIEGLQSRHGDEQARLQELLDLFSNDVVDSLEYDDGHDGAPVEGSVAWLQRQLADKIVEVNGVVGTADDSAGDLAGEVVAAKDKAGRNVLCALAFGAGVVVKTFLRK